jgi:type I restriction enzyme S subunit
MITTADCGITAVFRKQNISYIASAYAIKLTPTDRINSEFIKYFMQTPQAMNQIKSFVRKGTVANLPGSDVMNLILALPIIEEQNKISSILIAADNQIDLKNIRLEALINTKKALMQDLLTGKVRVNL